MGATSESSCSGGILGAGVSAAAGLGGVACEAGGVWARMLASPGTSRIEHSAAVKLRKVDTVMISSLDRLSAKYSQIYWTFCVWRYLSEGKSFGCVCMNCYGIFNICGVAAGQSSENRDIAVFSLFNHQPVALVEAFDREFEAS